MGQRCKIGFLVLFWPALILGQAQTLSELETLVSPAENFTMTFSLVDGVPKYRLLLEGEPVVEESRLGIELKDQESLLDGFSILSTTTTSLDEQWSPVWGEVKVIRNHYNELAVTLKQQPSGRRLLIRFRLFNDGLGFRYEFPEQPDLSYFMVADEHTEFAMAGDHQAFLDSWRL